jgi:type I restriction enzyme S subunit
VGCVGEIGNVICGKTPPTSEKAYFGDYIPFITIPDMHNNIFVTHTNRGLSEQGEVFQKNKTIPQGSICVSCIATPGLVSLSTQSSQTNQQINSIVLHAKDELYYWFFVMRMLGREIQESGSGGSIYSNLSKSRFEEMKMPVAPSAIRLHFHKVIDPQFELLLCNIRQIRLLTNLRDTLLPKLISGELRVPEAEQMVAELEL